MATQRYCNHPVGRAVYFLIIVLGACGGPVQLFGLFLAVTGSLTFPPETISLGTYAGIVFVMVVGYAALVLFGVRCLTARLEVDILGMRERAWWCSQGLDVTWDTITAWGVRVVVTTQECSDSWEPQRTWTVENRRARLEVEVNRPPRRITLDQGVAFYREIGVALRAQVPEKELSLPVETASGARTTWG